jgi:hypothetical protein
MKIYDIIAEDSQLDEAYGIEKIPSVWKVGTQLLAKPKAIKDLAELWKAEIISAQRAGVKPNFEVPRGAIPDEFAKDPAVLKAAQKQAEKLAKIEITAAQKAQVLSQVKEITSGIYKGWSRAKLIAKLTTLGWIAYEGMIEPIWNYMTIMNAMEADLKAKKMSPEEYEANRQNEMSVMLGTVARNILAVGLVQGPMRFLNLVFGRVPGLGSALRGISLVGQGALLNWLQNNKTAQEMTASVMTYSIIPELVGAAGVKAVNWLKSVLPQVLGGTDVDAERTAKVQQQQGRGDAPADKPDASPTKPAGKATSISPEFERTPAAKGELPGIRIKTDVDKIF